MFPDIDIYAEGICYFIDPDFAPNLHRTAMHSIITGVLLLVFFSLLERIVHKKQRQLYDIEADTLEDDLMLAVNGIHSSEQKSPGINFRVFGVGLYAGMLVHIMLDIVFWFSKIDLLFPLSLFKIAVEVDAWKYTPPTYGLVILTLSETFAFAVFLTVLRVSVIKKLGKWAHKNPSEIKAKRLNVTDNDMQSMEFSLYMQDEICPLDHKTLTRARPALAVSKFLIVFQYLYFIALCPLAYFVDPNTINLAVFSELMIICIPSYCYLAWALRDVILHKTDV